MSPPQNTESNAIESMPDLEIERVLTETNETDTDADVEIESGLSEDDKTKNVISSFGSLNTEIQKVNVATLVFFDVETTGLAKSIGKKNVQITEVSMIAVGRNEFCRCTYPDLRDVRVIHKLSLCIRPNCPVFGEAARITGLSNDKIQDQEPFDENTATAIISFLSHLQKPICILAHNGKVFDFPILKAEFEKLSIQLPSDFYIVDTLVGFRTLDVPDLPFNQKLHKDVKFKKNGSISYALQNLHLYFFGKQHLGSHSAEGDCIALAKVCHKVRDKIIPWIDENCSNFDSIKPMW